MFQKNQKLVCVDASGFHTSDGNQPKKYEVITSSGLCTCHFEQGISLAEYQTYKDGVVQCFLPHRFRPLSDFSQELTEEITQKIEREFKPQLV